MTEAPDFLLFLVSGTTPVVALAVFYVARSLWMVRREWHACRADTKVLYLLVAPPLTLAVDLLEITDRLFWTGDKRAAEPVPAQQVIRMGRTPRADAGGARPFRYVHR